LRSIADPGRHDNTAQRVFTALRETTSPDTEETNASPTYDRPRDDYRGAAAGDAHPLDVEPPCIEMRTDGDYAMSNTRCASTCRIYARTSSRCMR